MKNYLINRYALSEEGAVDMIKAIRWNTLVNISYILPAFLSFYILSNFIPMLLGENEFKIFNVWIVAFIGIFIIVFLFFMERKKYDFSYTRVYNESAKNRINLAETLRKLPLAYFGKRDVADLTSTIMQDSTELENVYSYAISGLYSSLFSSAILSFMLIIYNIKMATALLWIIPVTLVFFILSSKKLKSEFVKTHGAKLNVSSCFQEGLDAISEIKAYNYEKKYSKELNQLLDSYEKILTKEETIAGAAISISFSLLKFGLVSVVIIGAILFAKSEIDLFTYIVFMIMTSSIYVPIQSAVENMAIIKYADVRIDRLKQIREMPVQNGKTEFYLKDYNIKFENVKFSYEEDIKVLNGISFEANQHQVTAFVGSSGGGKSTTAKLAARFWDIDSGKITLGGEDISQIDPETLLKYYSIVFQDVTLFNLSILENIRIGKKDATDEEVLRVAKLAQCDDIAKKCANGYNTLIGENGEKLSGGERQRISIARAMLKDAPIIILDEATASVDAENESKIQIALSELVKDKTVLVIAHRMRTIRNADKIVVLQDGEIVEMGSPDELINSKGVFYNMNKMQNSCM